MSGEKHRVVVASVDVEEYESRGYVQSATPVEHHVGTQMWGVLRPEDRERLRLMEIDKAKHKAQNKLPQRFMLEMPQAAFAARADVPAFELMEAGELQSIVARASADTCPVEVESASLFETRREAVVAGRDRILTEIEAHRAVADGLEKFLKRYEVL